MAETMEMDMMMNGWSSVCKGRKVMITPGQITVNI